MDKEKCVEYLIMDAIDTLLSWSVAKEHLIIAYSKLIGIYIERCMHVKYPFGVPFINSTHFAGVEIYPNHPYNEIVIYVKDSAAFNPSKIIKIEFTNNPMGEGDKLYNPLFNKYVLQPK